VAAFLNKTRKINLVLILKNIMMKKIFLLSVISLLFSTGMTAQNAWEVLVNWDASSQNCYCTSYATAQFKVVLEIYDVANDASVGAQTVYVSYTASSYTFDCSNSPIDVDYYCNVLNPEYTPNFTIKCRVTFGHFGGLIPEEHCTAVDWAYDKTCYDFNMGFVFPQLYLN
jgi:hypothetical protein